MNLYRDELALFHFERLQLEVAIRDLKVPAFLQLHLATLHRCSVASGSRRATSQVQIAALDF